MKKAIAVFTMLTFALASRGGIVLSDSFAYPDGQLTVVSMGVWAVHSSGAIQLTVTNQQARLFGASGAEDDSASLAGAPYLSSDVSIKLYSSYSLIISNDLPSTAFGSYITHFKGTNTGAATDFGARVFVSRTNTIAQGAVPAGKFRISVGNGSGATNANDFGQINQDLDTNTYYTVVTRFVPSTGVSTIWLNPNAESDPSATAVDTGTVVAPNAFNVFSYGMRQNAAGGTCFIDNLKIGTQFADVAGPNQAPVISPIPDQHIPANGNTGPLPFTVSDPETVASSLTVTATSSNTVIVPNGSPNIVLGGSGTNRTISITPAANQQGTATIAVNVSDSVNNSFTTFEVTVGAPTLSSIPDQTFVTNTPIPTIPFTVSDAENDTISLSAASSNTNLITTNNIVFGGSGANRTLTLTPAAGQLGVSIITISASDGHTTVSTSFRLTMRPLLGLLYDENFLYTAFDNPNALYLATGGSGAMYGPWKHVSGPSEQMQVTNGWAYLVRTNDEDLGASLTNAPYYGSNGVVFYASFPVSFSALPSTLGDYFVHLKQSDTDTINFRCKVFTATGGAESNKFRLGIANQANSPVYFPQSLSLGDTNTVVMRYNSGTGQSTLWINPRAEGSYSVVATDSPGESDIGGVGLRQPGAFIGDLAVGHLKVGTSYTDVATVVPPPTPETLNAQIVGGQLVLTWTKPAFLLASSTAVTGPYIPIFGSTSPYTNSIAASQQFFRLVYP